MFNEQIKALRKQFNISQTQLAKSLQVTQQAVGKWENGKSIPDSGTLTKIAEYFKISVDFLLGNKNEMSSFGLEYNNADDENSGHAIPVIGTVRAGYNSFAFSEDFGQEYANVSHPENYFYLIVKGDSMEPKIRDGDLALIHRQSTLNDGELGVVVYGDNEGTLKKFVKKGNTVILQPFNSDYEAKVLSGEELNSIYIAGKVVETKTKW